MIVVEILDRLSRKLSEIARVHDELQFARVGLHAVSLGRVEMMHAGMLGTMAQIYVAREDPAWSACPHSAGTSAIEEGLYQPSMKQRLADLESLLEDAELRDEAMESIRSMIERIVVSPRDCGGVNLELYGDLARILTVCSQNAKTPLRDEAGFSLSVVAGARDHLYRTRIRVV